MGQRKVTMNKYTEIMRDWNYGGSSTVTSLLVWDLKRFGA